MRLERDRLRPQLFELGSHIIDNIAGREDGHNLACRGRSFTREVGCRQASDLSIDQDRFEVQMLKKANFQSTFNADCLE